MFTTPARAWLATAATGLSLAVVAAPAMADTAAFPDPAGDALAFIGDEVQAGEFGIDLRSVDVDHGLDDLVVTAVFADLQPGAWTDAALYVDTNIDGVADYGVYWTPDSNPLVLALDSDGMATDATCTVLDGTAQRFGAGGTSTVAVPRQCLGTPGRAAVHLDVIRSEQTSDDLYADSAPGDPGSTLRQFGAAVPVTRVVVAPTPQAQPAAVPVSSDVTVKQTRKVQRLGRTPVRLTIRAAAVDGVVTVRDGRRVLKRIVVPAGRATSYRLPRRLKVGLHKIAVTFEPVAGTSYTASRKVVRVRVKR